MGYEDKSMHIYNLLDGTDFYSKDDTKGKNFIFIKDNILLSYQFKENEFNFWYFNGQNLNLIKNIKS
jgi:hypothetical protein